MKKILKSRVFLVIITIILTLGTTVGAAVLYEANQVSYTPQDSSWNVSTVEGALNNLYSKFSTINTEYTNFKSTIAQAITNVGIETEETATAQTMAENISNLGGNTINTTGIKSGTFTGNLMEIETGFKPTGIAVLAPVWYTPDGGGKYSFSTMCVNSSWRASFTDSASPSTNYTNGGNTQGIIFTNSGFTVANKIGNGTGTFNYVAWDDTKTNNITTGSFTGKATVDCGFKPTGIAILAPTWYTPDGGGRYSFSTMCVNSTWRASFTDSGSPSTNYTNGGNTQGITFTDTGFSVANKIGNGTGTFYYVAWKE